VEIIIDPSAGDMTFYIVDILVLISTTRAQHKVKNAN
jgi:hypothetical protein